MTRENGDIKKIRELIKLMEEHHLVELEIAQGDDRVCLKRSHPQGPSITTPYLSLGSPLSAGPQAADQAGAPVVHGDGKDEGLKEIKSPLVGTFYVASSPDSDPYVEVGTHVDPQTVVCIIEAMKVMNEIKAEIGGTIVDVVATTGQAVEFGQPLFKVRPD